MLDLSAARRSNFNDRLRRFDTKPGSDRRTDGRTLYGRRYHT